MPRSTRVGPKRRAVLALLTVAEARAVTVDHLVDALWPSDPPESGRAALHSHVSRLPGHLGSAGARLETLDGGYRLVLADLAEIAPLATSAVALEQLHREVTDLLIACAIDAAQIDAAQVDGVVGLAAEALAADPLREPAVLLLIRALAATGRAPPALREGREYRRRLAEEAASTRHRL